MVSKLRSCFLLFAFLSVCTVVHCQEAFASHLDHLIEDLPKGSDVAIAVRDLTTGEMLYTYRADKLVRPASTMKLLTAITALDRPDANEPFYTELWYKGHVKRNVLHGDLYVVGGFDPEFNDAGMNALVDSIAAHFSSIKGTIYGDVSMKDSLYWGNGWMWDDNPSDFQPYLSPLMYHKGVVTVVAHPGEAGDTAHITTSPSSAYYSVTNLTRSNRASAGEFQVSRNWLDEGNAIVVSGDVRRRESMDVNVYSSADFFLFTLLQRLQNQHIRIPEDYFFSEFVADSTAVRLCRWECSMQTALNQMMKNSDNLNAEAFLCRLGRQATGKKRIAASDGIKEINKLIIAMGRKPADYLLVDGCGLSNYDNLSAGLLVDFLSYAYARPALFNALYSSLPISGVDGTLRSRMRSGNAYRNVHAKTGSYTAVNNLAGYLKAANGHDIAFAIMNQNILSERAAQRFQDKCCEVLCSEIRM